MTGGNGVYDFDFFTLHPTLSGFDTITDYEIGHDVVLISRSEAGIIASGTVPIEGVNLFNVTGGPPVNGFGGPFGELIFDQDNSVLYFDPDGAGASAPRAFAFLNGIHDPFPGGPTGGIWWLI